ncbi:MAG: N-acetyltransferase [bacterium]|nr:N-acetyltransferase [bacterium]
MHHIVTRKSTADDTGAIWEIFNYFVLNSFAAYADKEVPEIFMAKFAHSAKISFVLEVDNRVVGFACINPYKEFDNFKHTGVLTYFILPEYTRRGLGTRLLNELFDDARKQGITNLLANISSKNEQSLQFHKKHGFTECGLFKNMGTKNGEFFDIIWVQRDITL